MITFSDFLETSDKLDTSSYGPQFTSNPNIFILGIGSILTDDYQLQVITETKTEWLPLTEGLLRLIFLRNPYDYTSDDLKSYSNIIRLTRLHYTKRGQGHRINTQNKIRKFKDIISPCTRIEGSGLIFKAQHRNDVHFYKNYNELVDRLRILYGEILAGNDAIKNEFVSLLTILIENRVIKETAKSKLMIKRITH